MKKIRVLKETDLCKKEKHLDCVSFSISAWLSSKRVLLMCICPCHHNEYRKGRRLEDEG